MKWKSHFLFCQNRGGSGNEFSALKVESKRFQSVIIVIEKDSFQVKTSFCVMLAVRLNPRVPGFVVNLSFGRYREV